MNKDRRLAILYTIASGFFFSLMSFFVSLAGDMPVLQKSFFRNIVALCIALPVVLRNPESIRISKPALKDLFFRCLCGTIGIVCNFYAISKMTLSDANMLNKLAPFFSIIMSYIIMREKPSHTDWLAVTVAFTGSLLILKPSFSAHFAYAFIGAMGGFGAGTAYAFVHKLGGEGVSKSLIVAAFALFSSIVALPSMLYHGLSDVSMHQIIILVFAGLSAAGGQFTITNAYTHAAAKDISVYEYSQVIFAAILGIFFLGQRPDIFSVLGYIIIIGSAVFKQKAAAHSK